ncbi:unnamed protein product [Linum trigynum]|uniref:Uncharacterized protein n=1 Tax=Linum trigynum TaxID=586398 RepID=A0AAV2FTK9_9ROSI
MNVKHAELDKKFLKSISTQTFSENVCKLLDRCDLGGKNIASKNSFSNKITVHFNMLGAFMENRVSSDAQGSLIITKERGRSTQGMTKFGRKPPQPNELTDSDGHGTILSLSRRTCNN